MASELKIGTPVALFTGNEENPLFIEGSSIVVGHQEEQNNHCVTTEENGLRSIDGEVKVKPSGEAGPISSSNVRHLVLAQRNKHQLLFRPVTC
jgi:hypothetical protein